MPSPELPGSELPPELPLDCHSNATPTFAECTLSIFGYGGPASRVGRLEERFVGATRGRGTATEERCIGAWRSDGHIRIALGLGSGAPRRRGLGFLLSLDRAEVSATAQRWCFRGRGASSRSVGVLYVGAAFGDDDDEEVDGGELTMECQLLYT